MNLQNDIISYLATQEKPLVMYGMGNGADKILRLFSLHGIEISDFFASDDFVRGHFFHGKKVLHYADICEKYDDFIIILSFATSRGEVLGRIYEMDRQNELYAPDVPVCPDSPVFDAAFAAAHGDELSSARNLLCDEESKQLFDDIVNFRLTWKIDYLRRHISDNNDIFQTILPSHGYRSYFDAGAYTGDTVRQMLAFSPDLNRIWAAEPDIKNFAKLTAYSDNLGIDVNAVNCAVWDTSGEEHFRTGAGRGATVDNTAGGKTVALKTIDDILGGERVDFIKFDVEGSEKQALAGARQTIERHRPDMLVSLYHRSEDIFSLPILVNRLTGGEYTFYLRRTECLPAWELSLLALAKKK